MNRLIKRLMLYLLLLVSFCVVANDAYIEKNELIQSLESRNIDIIVQALNDIKSMRYSGDILPLIKDLWEGKEEKWPDVPFDVVEKPIIKIELADILLQARSNGLIEINVDQYQNYLRNILSSKDLKVVANAVLILSGIEDKDDIPLILNVAKKNNQVTFRAAILALSTMCIPEADIALRKYESSLSDLDLKKYVNDTRIKMGEFKKNTNMCDW
ncbi:MAG TPA: hypothetical protein VIQ81_05265 [Gammaproteobacteria bacterium]